MAPTIQQRVISPLPDPEIGELSVQLEEYASVPFGGNEDGLIPIQYTYHAGDGSGRLFTGDANGKVFVISEEGELDPQPFLDMESALQLENDPFIVTPLSGGLRSFAFHPDYENEGTSGYGKFYTLNVERLRFAPEETFVFSADGRFTPTVQDVLREWDVDPNDPNRILPNSGREIFRIDEPAAGHSADTILFNPNANPGDPDYGLLYMLTADGKFSAAPDPFRVVQDPGSILGKAIRFDPLEQPDGAAWGVPADNPFVNDEAYLPEIWALGFRHPQNVAFDTGGSQNLIASDIGQGSIEEVNVIEPGRNYGWPFREGTFATSEDGVSYPTGPQIYELPPNDEEFGYTYPVAQYDHNEDDGLIAIAGGYVYRGSNLPGATFDGLYIFGDIVTGEIYYASVDDLIAAEATGTQAEIKELTLIVDGSPTKLLDVISEETGADRVDLRFGQDENGEVYITSKQNGKIYSLSVEDDQLVGDDFDNVIIGNEEDDTLSGGIGDDTLKGKLGDDLLLGGEGDDFLSGGRGADSLNGGVGDDSYGGHAGEDTFVIGVGLGIDRIWDFTQGEDQIGLADGLTFDDLSFDDWTYKSVDGEVLPRAIVRVEDEMIAWMNKLTALAFTADDFIDNYSIDGVIPV